MNFDYKLDFVIDKNNYTFRTLRSDDVSDEYINCLNEERKYIKNIPEKINIETQIKYINDILSSPNNSICGLFLDKLLIGTAGIQNLLGKDLVEVVDGFTENCTLGIFILRKASRGSGLGKTLIWASCILANKNFNLKVFEACMNKTNVPSLYSFLSCGFVIIKENYNSLNVVLNFEDLIQPKLIDNVTISPESE